MKSLFLHTTRKVRVSKSSSAVLLEETFRFYVEMYNRVSFSGKAKVKPLNLLQLPLRMTKKGSNGDVELFWKLKNLNYLINSKNPWSEILFSEKNSFWKCLNP